MYRVERCRNISAALCRGSYHPVVDLVESVVDELGHVGLYVTAEAAEVSVWDHDERCSGREV